MARRAGRPGSWLVTDDYTGVTCYQSEVQRDYWGSYAKKPLLRNLQEIASPLNDPEPVSLFRGPNYEQISTLCVGSVAPIKIGVTNINTSQNNAAFQALNLHPGVGSMEIDCSFQVY